LATYGDEESGIPPEEPYTRLDAEYALNNAKMVLSLVEKLLKETESRT
jgi:HEPN domain-containing protein